MRGDYAFFYAEKGIDAWLLGIKTGYFPFKKRNDFIEQYTEQIPGMIDEVRNKVKQNKNSSLTRSEQEILDITAYLEQGLLYQSPYSFTDVFAKKIHQHTSEIEAYAQPELLEQKGGRAQLGSVIGIYNEQRLQRYFHFLNKLANQVTVDFAISLVANNHMINLCYSATEKLWIMMNLNLETLILNANDDTFSQFSNYIYKSYFQKKLSPLTLYSKIFSRQDNKDLLQPLVYDFLQNVKFSGLDPDSNNIEIISLLKNKKAAVAYAENLVSENDNQKLTILLNEKTTDGKYIYHDPTYLSGAVTRAATLNNKSILQMLVDAKNTHDDYSIDLNNISDLSPPALLAAANASSTCLELLINAKDKNGEFRVDLNKCGEINASPVYAAAHEGHSACLKLLVDAKNQNGTFRVDLSNVTTEGVSPISIAIQKGHVECLQILIDAKNGDGTFRVDLSALKTWLSLIYVAAHTGHVDCLKVLIDAKNNDGSPRVDLSKKSEKHGTALSIAFEKNNPEIIEVLINAKHNGKPRVNLDQPEVIVFIHAIFKRDKLIKQVETLLSENNNPIDQESLRQQKHKILNEYKQDYKKFLFDAPSEEIKLKTFNALMIDLLTWYCNTRDEKKSAYSIFATSDNSHKLAAADALRKAISANTFLDIKYINALLDGELGKLIENNLKSFFPNVTLKHFLKEKTASLKNRLS